MSAVCARCDVDYPDDDYLAPIHGTLVTGPVCGICALDLVNAVHGTTRTRFMGGGAERLRKAAVAWRAKQTKSVTK